MDFSALPPLTGSVLFDPWRIRYREQLAGGGRPAHPRRATRSETMLWQALAGSAHLWVAEHPTRYGYTLDFYCSQARLAVEVDGASHWGPAKAERDAWRDLVHERMGIRTKRFSAREVETEVAWVVQEVEALVADRLRDLAAGESGPGVHEAGGALAPRARRSPVQQRAHQPGSAVDGNGDVNGSGDLDGIQDLDDLGDLDGDERLFLFPPEPAGWSASLPACVTVLPVLPERRGLRDLVARTLR